MCTDEDVWNTKAVYKIIAEKSALICNRIGCTVSEKNEKVMVGKSMF
jgi:hypothetical protein